MMETLDFHPDQAEFVILSFEGPDRYALAGGLGVRVANLANTLASKGYRTHLIYVGDPALPWHEEKLPGNPASHNGNGQHAAGCLHLYRWCQWISRNHPTGVYDGEEGKVIDYSSSLPPFIVERIARPAIERGRYLIVLAEEWHTADALMRLSDQLQDAGLRSHSVLLWNANNTMGFHRMDWARLGFVATLTTVSRYMKHIMRLYGLDPLIIPNGIPSDLFAPLPSGAINTVREQLCGHGEKLLIKVGRYDPAKCWWMAVEAAAQLKRQGTPVVFLARGGIEPHGMEVLNHARELGLVVRDVDGRPENWKDVLDLIQAAGPADLYQLRFYMPQDILRIFYAAADVVLANSKHEPFGLVGLEGMAAGGIVFTGPTGETYSTDGEGAVALDTESADEIVLHLEALERQPERALALHEAATKVAARYTWENVLEVLFEKIRLAACQQKTQSFVVQNRPCRPVQDVVVYTVVHQPRRLRLPARAIPKGASAEALGKLLFDEAMDQRYFQKVAARCYYPATRKFLELVQTTSFKLTIGFSMSFIRQCQRWDPELLNLYIRLVQHPNVELALVEPYHSFILLWDVQRFSQRMQQARDELAAIFGKTPQVADTTELMMSDTIYHALDQAGFKGAFLDGRPWVMGWRQPSYLYRHNGSSMHLLARHYQLSDDVGYRFSNRGWSGWPLMAPNYADWIANAQGDLMMLGWDYETFGEHHNKESGIFEFLESFAREIPMRGLRFCTASEAIDRHAQETHDLPLPVFHSTWAGSGGLDFFLGNSAQQNVFQLMMSAYNKALLTGDPEMVDLALWLAMSDNLHLIQWYGRSGSEAEVSAYFTPQEWWRLGPDRIIAEIQQVYRNFINALDEHLAPRPIADSAKIKEKEITKASTPASTNRITVPLSVLK